MDSLDAATAADNLIRQLRFIDAAIAIDNARHQPRADRHEARGREQHSQEEVRYEEEDAAHYRGEDRRKMRSVEDEIAVLRQRLSRVEETVEEREEVIEELDGLKQRIRNLERLSQLSKTR